MAGRYSAMAVPDVEIKATACPVAFAIPRPKNAALRSSRCTDISSPSVSAAAIASGVFREPGLIAMWSRPSSLRVASSGLVKA